MTAPRRTDDSVTGTSRRSLPGLDQVGEHDVVVPVVPGAVVERPTASDQAQLWPVDPPVHLICGKLPLLKRSTRSTENSAVELFSVTEAAEACSLSQKTIKRRLSEGAFPGAYKEPMSARGGNERGLIPLADLLAAGLRPNAARRATGADVDLTDAAGNGGDQYRGEVVRLRRELAEARQEAAVAKALAAERLRSLDDARLANERQHRTMLLMLGGSSPRAASEQPHP